MSGGARLLPWAAFILGETGTVCPFLPRCELLAVPWQEARGQVLARSAQHHLAGHLLSASLLANWKHTVFSCFGLAPYFPSLGGMCRKCAFIHSGPPV